MYVVVGGNAHDPSFVLGVFNTQYEARSFLQTYTDEKFDYYLLQCWAVPGNAWPHPPKKLSETEIQIWRMKENA